MNIRGYRPRLYGIWAKMRGRCNTGTNKNYPDYGGRGISVCKDWDSYENFYAWANVSGYSDALTLDRINNDGNYEPSNCRWATKVEQARNTRRNIMISCDGETLPLIAWAERTGFPYGRLRSRVRMGWAPAEILERAERHVKITNRRGSKLTEGQVRHIKEATGLGTEMAAKYGVSKALISRIRSGQIWKGRAL